MNAPEFDLKGTTLDVLAESGSDSLDELAAAVFLRIPKELHGRVLAGLLRGYVREVIRTTRAHHAEVDPDSVVVPIRSSRSRKRAAIKAAWQRRLEDRVHAGNSVYKPLADCTYADLVYAADERQQAAERTLFQAASYRRMAEAVKAAGVATFGELPEHVQAEVLGAA